MASRYGNPKIHGTGSPHRSRPLDSHGYFRVVIAPGRYEVQGKLSGRFGFVTTLTTVILVQAGMTVHPDLFVGLF